MEYTNTNIKSKSNIPSAAYLNLRSKMSIGNNTIKQGKALSENNSLKKGIWLYLFFIIFEGALRKWFLPGLSTPLLIVRDPIALWLLIKANKKHLIVMNGYISMSIFLAVFGTLSAMVIGHGNIFVAIYGARIFILHFPLMFVIGRVFTKEDVLKMGRVLLWVTLPMTVLVAMQFNSPQSAWVNRGLGGDLAGAGFDGALGYFRPPATFSFISGTISYYAMVSSYIIYFWLTPKTVNRLLLIAASICLIITVPLSISRSLFFDVVITLVFGMFVISRNPKYITKLIPIVLFLFVALAILGSTGIFKTSSEAFTSRFDTANEQEGGLQSVLLDRFLGGMLSALSGSSYIPLFGYGLGLGTNVGSMLISGKVTYLVAEVEWGRLIGEMGAILGITSILIRVLLVWKMAVKSYKKMVNGDILPWMLLSFGLLTIAQGQWAQPTILGFSTLIGGLILAALNDGVAPVNKI